MPGNVINFFTNLHKLVGDFSKLAILELQSFIIIIIINVLNNNNANQIFRLV